MSRAWRSEKARPAGSGVTEFGSSCPGDGFSRRWADQSGCKAGSSQSQGGAGGLEGRGENSVRGRGLHQALWAL